VNTLIKGIIFDLDGTLIDSMGIWTTIDRAFLKENGVEDPPCDVSDKVRKMSVEESSEYFIKEFGLSCTVEYVIRRIEELVRVQYEEKIELKQGVTELLDYLDEKGIPYGVATATYKKLAEAVLERHGIRSRFRFILTDSEYPAGKTSPDIFLGGAEKLKLNPEEILVAEDSLHCIETAVKAGFYTVGVSDEISANDRESIEKTADAYVERIDEIIRLIG